tara:strand:+ start:322 stop:1599 length:1278 start_codon:yes stop_codon:yes gene_type:complete
MVLENPKNEKAYLIGVVLNTEDALNINEELNELESLANTAGAKTIGRAYQHRIAPDAATFIGKGKANTIIAQASELDCNLIIFNNDISPTQIKNMQKIAGDKLKVIDRTGLILDIFTKHAKTKEAKTQVQLAQLEYMLPRLTRQWTHLERQMGGVGTRAGAGETQIEVDRRLVRNQISKLKKDLSAIEKQRNIQNYGRDSTYRIALVGYTNAGKSTIMENLTGADIYVANKLFATLDTTTRKISMDVGIQVLISDTVGFIRNLPHNLIASFRSTLGEIENVDLILKVVDISSEVVKKHIDTIDEVLSSLKLNNKPFIQVFNKIDQLSNSDEKNILVNKYSNAIFISAKENLGVESLIKKIERQVRSSYIKQVFNITHEQSKHLDSIYKLTRVIDRKEDYNCIKLKVEGSINSIKKIKQIIANKNK